jgi:hypothetical protein
MEQSEYDEYMRRWRRKFFAWMAVGVVVGVVLAIRLTHYTR